MYIRMLDYVCMLAGSRGRGWGSQCTYYPHCVHTTLKDDEYVANISLGNVFLIVFLYQIPLQCVQTQTDEIIIVISTANGHTFGQYNYLILK